MSSDAVRTLTRERAAPSSPAAERAGSTGVARDWRRNGIGVVRIAFGLVWLVDAAFKWAPSFHNNLDSYLSDGAEGQPAAVQAWIGFWTKVIGVQPHWFGFFFAIAEAALAIALILGLFSHLSYIAGIVLTLGIWSTAEGFGGPYKAGSADIGAAIIYAFVFALLFLSCAGQYLGLDRALGPKLGRWNVLASGPLVSRPSGGDATGAQPAEREHHGIG